MIYITTSWDDGYILDFKIAGLLEKYKIRGTFYVSKNYPLEGGLSDSEVAILAKSHEIGSHTINHPNLLRIPPAEAGQEIDGGKKWLEDILGKKIEMFCYPYGCYNNEIINLVKRAGFLGARTTEKFVISEPDDFYKMGTTLHIYPFPFNRFKPRFFFQPYWQNRVGIKKLKIQFFSLRNWKSLSRAVFDKALESGNFFHLWGHSLEIEKYGMWKELEDFFAYIAGRKNCLYLTNGEVVNKYEDSDFIR